MIGYQSRGREDLRPHQALKKVILFGAFLFVISCNDDFETVSSVVWVWSFRFNVPECEVCQRAAQIRTALNTNSYRLRPAKGSRTLHSACYRTQRHHLHPSSQLGQRSDLCPKDTSAGFYHHSLNEWADERTAVAQMNSLSCYSLCQRIVACLWLPAVIQGH